MPDTCRVYDIFVVGGGINGCGIARDAAGRGHTVFLAEKNDLASGTSSASTKLIHGGLRYLEHWQFRLVRKALMEREVLWKIAPHIIKPVRFILPHHKGLRPAWLIRLGLFLYDHMGGRVLLPPTHTVDLRHDEVGEPLKPVFTKGFEYSDCWVDDARLVVLNAVDAQRRGAVIRTHTRVTGADYDDGVWIVHLENNKTGEAGHVRARVLVNATGPWVDTVLQTSTGQHGRHNVRLVSGSHIVVKKLFDHDRGYVFQNADGRIVFAIPYETGFTMIGTTDRDYHGDPDDAEMTADEISYLCHAAGEYFESPIEPDQVVWQFSGVRPLFADGASTAQEVPRDYVLRVDNRAGNSGLITVFGGKITTYRRLAEAALESVETILGAKGMPWTESTPLPGGDFAAGTLDKLTDQLSASFPFLDDTHAARLTRLYGTNARKLLSGARSEGDLGKHFGADLYAIEIDYLMENECALYAADVLYRRTKLGLHLDSHEVAQVRRFMDENRERIGQRSA